MKEQSILAEDAYPIKEKKLKHGANSSFLYPSCHKWLFLLFITLCATLMGSLPSPAQRMGSGEVYDAKNSVARRVIVHYSPDAQGIYHKSTQKTVESVDSIVEIYAYNKRIGAIYVLTEIGNYEVELKGAQERIMRRDRAIPHLTGITLDNAIAARNIQLVELIDQRNIYYKERAKATLEARQKFVADSLSTVYDSLEKKRWEDAQQAYAAQKRKQYIENHPWNLVPTKGHRLICMDSGCDSESKTSMLRTYGISSDTLFYSTTEQLPLDFQYEKVHKVLLPKTLQEDPDYRYHWEIFNDSLRAHPFSSEAQVIQNTAEYLSALNRLKQFAPYGFVRDWSWHNDASVSFHFSYTNLNDNPIRDIEIHWTLSTDAGEARTSGVFKGSGMLKSGSSHTWDWDTSTYKAPADATNMVLTKLVITFADGKQQVIPKSAIRIEQ